MIDSKFQSRLQSELSSALANEKISIELALDVASLVIGFCDHNPSSRLEYKGFSSIVIEKKARGLSASTAKPSNFSFNLGEMLEALASGVFTIASIVSTPWLVPFGFLLLWRSILGAFKISLGEEEGMVLLGLWYAQARDGTANIKSIKKNVRNLCKTYSIQPFRQQRILSILDSLSKLKCVQKIPEEDSWRVVERLTIRYLDA